MQDFRFYQQSAGYNCPLLLRFNEEAVFLSLGWRETRRSIWVVGAHHREEVKSFAEKNDLAVFSYGKTEDMLPDEASSVLCGPLSRTKYWMLNSSYTAMLRTH
jgi:hypothetical protein